MSYLWMVHGCFHLRKEVSPSRRLLYSCKHENYGPQVRQTEPPGITVGRGISHGERGGGGGGHAPVPTPNASLEIFPSHLCFAWSILRLTCRVHFHILRKCFTPSERWSVTEDRIHAQPFLSLATFRIKLCSSSFSWIRDCFGCFMEFFSLQWSEFCDFGKVRFRTKK